MKNNNNGENSNSENIEQFEKMKFCYRFFSNGITSSSELFYTGDFFNKIENRSNLALIKWIKNNPKNGENKKVIDLIVCRELKCDLPI